MKALIFIGKINQVRALVENIAKEFGPMAGIGSVFENLKNRYRCPVHHTPPESDGGRGRLQLCSSGTAPGAPIKT